MLNTVKNYLADVQVLALRQSQKTKKKVYHSADRWASQPTVSLSINESLDNMFIQYLGSCDSLEDRDRE